MQLRIALYLALVGCVLATGCADKPSPGGAAPNPSPKPGGKPALTKPARVGVVVEEIGLEGTKIVLEAEQGTIEAPMQVYTDKASPAGTEGPRGASAGKYVETAEPTELDSHGKKKVAIGGSTTLGFDIPEDGKYCIWLRVYWRHNCANSFQVQRDDKSSEAELDQVTDNTEKSWHWVAVGKNTFTPTAFEFTKGKHTIKVTSREDGSVLDQVLIVDDAEYSPAGIEHAAGPM